MAQGVAWAARLRGIPCTVVVPDYAPKTKIAAIERLGGRVIPVPFADWWRAIEESRFPGLDGVFIHPVLDDAVMAGNGTIGLELLEDLPDLRCRRDPLGRGRTDVRHRERAPGAPSRGADLLGRAGDGRADGRVARRRRGHARSTTTARRSSTARAARRSCRRCGASAAGSSTAASSHRWTRRPRPCACSPNAPASSPRAPAALALAAALAGRAGRRAGRLHRLGRQHRQRAASRDSLRRHPFLENVSRRVPAPLTPRHQAITIEKIFDQRILHMKQPHA